MSANDRTLLALLAKGLRDLKDELRNLARQPGPPGERGADGINGRDGAPGERGPAGRDGKDGRDGADGIVGRDGERGEPGPPGRDGKDGKDGERGPIGPMPKHEWRGTELRFQLSEKRWGKWVQLRPAPARGGAVVTAGGGSGSFNPGSFPIAETIEPLDEMMIVRNGVFMRVQVVLQAGGDIPVNAVTVNGEAVTVNGQYVVVTN